MNETLDFTPSHLSRLSIKIDRLKLYHQLPFRKQNKNTAPQTPSLYP